MRRTREAATTPESICVTTDHLAELLQTGRCSAERLGTQANAKIKIGRRTLWNAAKVRQYINSISE